MKIGPYWPSERKLVDSGYADISFPFVEHSAPSIDMRKDWDFNELLGYISTWSAVRSAKEAGQEKAACLVRRRPDGFGGGPA